MAGRLATMDRRSPLRRLRRVVAPSRPSAVDPIAPLRAELELIRLAVGSEAARAARAAATLREAEFRCYSQNGEDGIIQWLLARVPIADPYFVEFGVGDYHEANTRFLLQHDNWRGLILDSGSAHIRTVSRGELAWKYGIEARSAFITAENVKAVLGDVPVDLRPRILVVEYNSVLGHSRPVAVPYDPAFNRFTAHYTIMYSGASIAAFCHWAATTGYRLVGANLAGNNAFFVRDDVAGALPALTAEEGWVGARFGRPRGRDGRPIHSCSPVERRSLIADMPLVDVATGERLTVGDLVS
jgi:hypothetical protein